MDTIDFFRNLPGNWNFERSIIEGSSTWFARGDATFTVVENETNALRYHEQGQLERALNQNIAFYSIIFTVITMNKLRLLSAL